MRFAWEALSIAAFTNLKRKTFFRRILRVMSAAILAVSAGCQSTVPELRTFIEKRSSGTYGDWTTESSQVGSLYWITSESFGTSSTVDSTFDAKLSVYRRLFSINTRHADLCSKKSCESNDCRLVSDWRLTWLTPERSTNQMRKRLQISRDRKSLLPMSASDNAEILQALNDYSYLVIEPSEFCAFGPILRFKTTGRHHLSVAAQGTNFAHASSDIFTEALDPKPLKFKNKRDSRGQDFFNDFATGEIGLRSAVPLSPLPKLRIAKNLKKISRQHKNRHWKDLAVTIIAQDISTPENYHLLGLAAYNLGYPSAAEIYLREAIALTNSLSPKVCAPSYCYGLQLPIDSTILLKQLVL